MGGKESWMGKGGRKNFLARLAAATAVAFDQQVGVARVFADPPAAAAAVGQKGRVQMCSRTSERGEWGGGDNVTDTGCNRVGRLPQGGSTAKGDAGNIYRAHERGAWTDQIWRNITSQDTDTHTRWGAGPGGTTGHTHAGAHTRAHTHTLAHTVLGKCISNQLMGLRTYLEIEGSGKCTQRRQVGGGV